MICRIFNSITSNKKVIPLHITIFRYLRNVSRREERPRLLKEASVKTVTAYEGDDFSNVKKYQDFMKCVRSSVHANDVEIEQALTSGEDFGEALAQASDLHDEDARKEKEHKSLVKKHIIGKKYFKLDKETNLLTYAAKEQIRYLHRLNPGEWNAETIPDSFPISVTGVKKLLKSDFVIRCPDKIKQHDIEVERRWNILTSSKPSQEISIHTQRLFDEGKIVKEHYKGNHNLPNVPPTLNKIIIENKKAEPVGEYSAIIQQYVKYKEKQQSSTQNLASLGDQLEVSDGTMNPVKNKESENQHNAEFRKSKYRIDDENEDHDYKPFSGMPIRKHASEDEEDLPYSQFKENFKEEMSSRKSRVDFRYLKWAEDQLKKEASQKTPKQSVSVNNFFSKISKYKVDTIELQREASNKKGSPYLYDETLGYQYPKGKVFCGKIRVPSNLHKKNTMYKVGNCVYDKDGEFLYKIPC